MIDSNISDLKVPQKDMIEYYRPFQMNVIVNGNSVSTNVNGKEFQNFAHYNINKKDYEIRFGDVMNYLNCLDKIDRKANGAIVSFTYDGKILYFEDSKETKVKGNKVPYMWTIKMFEDFFDAEIIYDYDNKRIYINTIKE